MTDQSTAAAALAAGHMAYTPLRITLTGFKGIRSGLGRDTLTLDLEATSAAPRWLRSPAPTAAGRPRC